MLGVGLMAKGAGWRLESGRSSVGWAAGCPVGQEGICYGGGCRCGLRDCCKAGIEEVGRISHG